MSISWTEKELLKAEQHILRDRINVYIYPVLTLPPEVVSEIFVHFLSVYPKRAPQKGLLSPIILAQICGLWRQIAFSTPRLWRTFGITLTDESDGAGQVSAVETLLQRSGSCPLSVEFSYSRYDASPLFQTITAHRARWQHLKLCIHVRDLSTMFGLGPFPILRSLTTTGWLASPMDFGYRSTTSLAAPLLHRVALGHY
ncbi:hypothetical protein C8F04DRAFT_967748 [Mycena alexandri]|uniref:F-box domain-containing protein n=1 Tax=Mycena alexandri TaxID=1745969 RepID=A0AAD6WW06_9AGAR|nr:hypothetical protein C8F04DRAFT_967748 [Mycena alexandri]